MEWLAVGEAEQTSNGFYPDTDDDRHYSVIPVMKTTWNTNNYTKLRETTYLAECNWSENEQNGATEDTFFKTPKRWAISDG